MTRLFFILLLVTATASIAVAADDTYKFPVEPIDEAGLKQLVNLRNDRILILNIWATWCPPCLKEFPELIRTAEYYQDQSVEVVGISADFPDEVDSKILPFLKQKKVNFKVFVKNADDEIFINYLNQEWNGALPATLIFDKSGKIRKFFPGEVTFALLKEGVESVLAN